MHADNRLLLHSQCTIVIGLVNTPVNATFHFLFFPSSLVSTPIFHHPQTPASRLSFYVLDIGLETRIFFAYCIVSFPACFLIFGNAVMLSFPSDFYFYLCTLLLVHVLIGVSGLILTAALHLTDPLPSSGNLGCLQLPTYSKFCCHERPMPVLSPLCIIIFPGYIPTHGILGYGVMCASLH